MNIVRALETGLVRLLGEPAFPGLIAATPFATRTDLAKPANVANAGFPGLLPEPRAADELSNLVNLANTFSSKQDVNEVLRELCRYLTETAHCTSARVYMPEPGASALILCASHSIRSPEDDKALERAFPTQIPEWGRAGLSERNPVAVRRESSPPGLAPLHDALLFGDGSQSSLLLPLATSDRFLGLVILSEMRSWSRSPFDAEKVARCRLIAQHVALVVENIRLQLIESELAQVKEDFVSLVSHELRVPLTHISAIADLLARGALDEHEKKDMLQSLDQECERLLYLGQVMPQILDPGPGEIEVEQEVVSITRLVQQRVEFFKSRNTDHNFAFEAPASTLMAQGNTILLSVVLDNLLSNAVKYSAPGTSIRTGVQDMDTRVLVCVEDEGIGIPQDQLEKIFARRHRVSDPALPGVPGSGLGLYVARRLIEHQGGRLWAESDYGRGSRLCFRIEKIEAADE